MSISESSSQQGVPDDNLQLTPQQQEDRQEAAKAYKAQIKFLLYHLLQMLPQQYQSLDPQRIVVMYFAIVGLDVLNALHLIPADKIPLIINTVYALQLDNHGWSGSPLLQSGEHTVGHLAATYSAICILLTLGDDLSRVNKKSIQTLIEKAIVILPQQQQPQQNKDDGQTTSQQQQQQLPCLFEGDQYKRLMAQQHQQQEETNDNHHMCQQLGCFYASTIHDEYDVRFTFCVMALCEMLDLWDVVSDKFNIPQIFTFLTSCQTYEGGFSLTDCGQESHGGATHTALMSYYLLLKYYVKKTQQEKQKDEEHNNNNNNIQSTITKFNQDNLIKWLLFRQGTAGWSGRTNKDQDTCYTYWLGSLLQLFNIDHFSAPTDAARFLYLAQNTLVGGFAKDPDSQQEILHTFYSLAGLSLLDTPRGYAMAINDNNNVNNNCNNENNNDNTKQQQQQQRYTGILPDNMMYPVKLNRIDPVLGLTTRITMANEPRKSFQQLFAELSKQ